MKFKTLVSIAVCTSEFDIKLEEYRDKIKEMLNTREHVPKKVK